MIIKQKPAAILAVEAIGFLLIILISWLDEVTGLPHIILGRHSFDRWNEAIVETIFVLLIWAFVHFTTRKMLNRLHYLEEFLRLCAWCRKVSFEGKWQPLEEYLDQNFDTKTSHGICPDCAIKIQKKNQEKKT